LSYDEGFLVNKNQFTHHAWVLNRISGTHHELTLRDLDPDARYLGQAFAKDELRVFGKPMSEPDGWARQLNLKSQFALLTGSGYDGELSRYLWSDENDEVAEVSSVDNAGS
jgi:hypothetical protein